MSDQVLDGPRTVLHGTAADKYSQRARFVRNATAVVSPPRLHAAGLTPTESREVAVHPAVVPAVSWAVPSIRFLRLHPALASITLACAVVVACGGEGSTSHPVDSSSAPPPPRMPAPASGPSVSTVVDTGPVLQDGHAVIRPEAVGPLHVGVWERVAMSFVYTITAFSAPDSTAIVPAYGAGKDTVTIVVVKDTVSQIEVMRPGARTVDGIQVGTPLATVRARPGATLGRDGTATTVRFARYCGITFSTADSSVHSGVSNAKHPLPFPPDSAVIRTIIVGKCTGA